MKGRPTVHVKQAIATARHNCELRFFFLPTHRRLSVDFRRADPCRRRKPAKKGKEKRRERRERGRKDKVKQSWQGTRAERREGTDVAMATTFGTGRSVKAARGIVITRRR